MVGCKSPVLVGLDGRWISNFYKPLPDSLCWKNDDQILFFFSLLTKSQICPRFLLLPSLWGGGQAAPF